VHGGGEQVGQPHAEEHRPGRAEPLQRGHLAGGGGDIDQRRTVSGDQRGHGRVLHPGGVDHDVNIGQRSSHGSSVGEVNHPVGPCGVPAGGDGDVAAGPKMPDDPGADGAVYPSTKALTRGPLVHRCNQKCGGVPGLRALTAWCGIGGKTPSAHSAVTWADVVVAPEDIAGVVGPFYRHQALAGGRRVDGCQVGPGY